MMGLVVAAAASWICFSPVNVCYDTANVRIQEPQIATIITDGPHQAMLIVNCRTHKHRVMSDEGFSDGVFEKGSIAETICNKYLPGT